MRTRVQAWALMCGLISVASCSSDTATNAYIAERNKAFATFKASNDNTAGLDQRLTSELERLQGMMRSIVGPIRLKGFPSSGAYYIDTLTQELGFGKLDAMSVESVDGKTQALVTTLPLLDDWLRRNPAVVNGAARTKKEALAWALASEEFYTAAYSDDAHYYKYAELPVAPADASAPVRAILYTPAQDYPAPLPPQGVLVALVHGDKLVLLRKSVAAPVIAACVEAYRHDMTEAEAALAAYYASKLADQAQFNRSLTLEEAANTHYLQCYAQRLPQTSSYALLVREAQTMVDTAE